MASLFSNPQSKAMNFARSIKDRNGWELWRRISPEYEPSSDARGLGMLDDIMHPDLSGTTQELEEKFMLWETHIDMYEGQMSKKLNEDIKRAVLLRRAPIHIAEHIRINIATIKTYADMK